MLDEKAYTSRRDSEKKATPNKAEAYAARPRIVDQVRQSGRGGGREGTDPAIRSLSFPAPNATGRDTGNGKWL